MKESLHPTTQLILGLQILCAYGVQSVSAEHDTIYCDAPYALTEEDKKYLTTLGWEETEYNWEFRP